jgi:hypothetical protein
MPAADVDGAVDPDTLATITCTDDVCYQALPSTHSYFTHQLNPPHRTGRVCRQASLLTISQHSLISQAGRYRRFLPGSRHWPIPRRVFPGRPSLNRRVGPPSAAASISTTILTDRWRRGHLTRRRCGSDAACRQRPFGGTACRQAAATLRSIQQQASRTCTLAAIDSDVGGNREASLRQGRAGLDPESPGLARPGWGGKTSQQRIGQTSAA